MTKTGLKYSVIAIVAFLLLISGVFPSFVQAQVYDYQGYGGSAYSAYQYPTYSYPSYYSSNYSYPTTYSQSYPAYNNGWTSSYGQPVYSGYSQYQYPQYQSQYQTPSYQYPNYQQYQNQYPSYSYQPYQYPQYTDLPLTVTCAPTLTTVEVGTPVTWSASAYGGIGNSYNGSGNSYTFVWTGESIVPRNANLATAYYLSPGIKTASVIVYSNGQTVTESCGTVLVTGRYIPSLWGGTY
ncbi:MAG: hypothetical protein V4481_03810 [Patescibacteria group bacterium]